MLDPLFGRARKSLWLPAPNQFLHSGNVNDAVVQVLTESRKVLVNEALVNVDSVACKNTLPLLD